MKLSDIGWLKSLLGFDAENIPPDAEIHFNFTNQPRSWEVFLMIAVVAALIYWITSLYRREIETCGPRMKLFLAGLRVLVVLVLVLVYLGPSVTYTQRRTLQPLVVLMRDDSQSFNSRDHYADDDTAQMVAGALGRSVEALRDAPPTRVELVQALFAKNDGALLKELERRGKLQIGDFAGDVRLKETRPARVDEPGAPDTGPDAADGGEPAEQVAEVRPLPAWDARGNSTDLHRAIVEATSDRLTAAVIFVTDGQHTGKDAGRDNLRAAAEQAREHGAKLFFVGVGDPTRPRNLQIADVYADPQVWRGDPFEIQAVLRAQGVGGIPVQVQLTEHQVSESTGETTAESVLETKDVPLPAEGGQVRLTFQHTPDTAGRYAYTVRVEPVDNELTEDDNQPATPIEVKVLSEQARVLLISGSPTWEYRSVQRLLHREKSVDLSCWLQTMDEERPQDGNTTIIRLPYEREQMFKYDVIMMFDPDPIEFDGEFIGLLKQFVSEHAGGFLYMAGPKYASRFLGGGRTAGLRDLLPVRLGDVEAMEVAALLSTNTRSWPLGVVAANIDQPIMRFYAEPQQSLTQWKKLPGIYWSFPTLDAKPASRVLIEHSDPTLRQIEGARPLLVTGQYGSGRTAFMGFNGTWRWRRVGANGEFFNRFWMQTTRYLIEGRSLEGKRRGVIESDRFRYELGDRITITAHLKDSSYKPLEDPEVTATLDIAGAPPETVTLKLVPNQPGQYEATLVGRQTGRHILAIDMAGGTGGPARVETTFSVSLPSVEVNDVWLDKALLVELAEASGGQYFEINELDKLAAAIPDRARTLDMQSKPFPLWDTNRVLWLLVALLALEWALRKRFKLL